MIYVKTPGNDPARHLATEYYFATEQVLKDTVFVLWSTSPTLVVGKFQNTLEEINDIKTAVSEAVTNAIVHAYPDSIGRICLRGRIMTSGELEISVRDWGKGMEDVEKARTPLFTTGGPERSGMGFTIMESFMDKLRVRSKPGKGTTVVMRRTLEKRRED